MGHAPVWEIWSCEIGYAISRVSFDLWDLVTLFGNLLRAGVLYIHLSPDIRGRGIGKEWGRKKGASWLWAWKDSGSSCKGWNLIFSFFQPNCKRCTSWAHLSSRKHSRRETTKTATQGKILNRGSTLGTMLNSRRAGHLPSFPLKGRWPLMPCNWNVPSVFVKLAGLL